MRSLQYYTDLRILTFFKTLMLIQKVNLQAQ